MGNDDIKSRAVFASKFAAVATTVGSAVGLGNIWRFPYEAGEHGGGAFVLCYVGFVLLIGVPVLYSEFFIGNVTGSNVFGAYRKLAPRGKWQIAGYLGIAASLMILSFYSVVAAWTLEYCVASAFGQLDFSGAEQVQFESLTTGWRPVVWTVIFLVVNTLILLRGVTKGIERASNIMMPLLFVLLVAFCINSVTLPGFKEGVTFLFHPDFSAITPGVLLGAMGQAFFSLSLGLGCMMTYASYFKKGTNLGKTAISTALLDTAVAVLAGVIIFPAVFSYGISPQAGPTLVFEVLPAIFTQLPGGYVWSTLFFLLLFLASLTSTMSMSEISISFFCDEKGMSRRRATLLSSAIALAGGLLCALSFGPLSHFTIAGMTLFNLFDYVASNVFLPVGGFVVAVFTGWVVNRQYLSQHFSIYGSKGPMLMNVLLLFLRWVCPAAIFIIFLNSIGLLNI